MLRTVQTAFAGYAERAREVSRLAERITRSDQDQAANLVGLIANQHAAEADLVVARVADQTTASLIHVVA